MALSLTPDLLGYIYDNGMEMRGNWTLPLRELGEFYLPGWMRMLSLVIVLAGVVGNSIVVWLRNFCTGKNSFSIYIVNLGWADVLFLCCHFIILINEFVRYLDPFFIYLLMINLANLFYATGLSLLAVISTDRCLATLFPSWYLYGRPKHMSGAVCAALWVIPGLFWIADFVLCNFVGNQVFCEDFFSIRVTWFLHFTPVLCVSSLTLLLRVQCSSQRQKPPRFYLLVLLMVLVFLLCGLPRGIQDAMSLFPLLSISGLLRLLSFLKSSVYPFIYFLLGSRRHSRMREPLRVVLQRALDDEQELEVGRMDSGLSNTRETSF